MSQQTYDGVIDKVAFKRTKEGALVAVVTSTIEVNSLPDAGSIGQLTGQVARITFEPSQTSYLDNQGSVVEFQELAS